MAGSGLTLLVGRAGVDGVGDGSVFERRVGVEDDRRLLVDGGAGGQAGLGLDGVLDVALADAALCSRGAGSRRRRPSGPGR